MIVDLLSMTLTFNFSVQSHVSDKQILIYIDLRPLGLTLNLMANNLVYVRDTSLYLHYFVCLKYLNIQSSIVHILAE